MIVAGLRQPELPDALAPNASNSGLSASISGLFLSNWRFLVDSRLQVRLNVLSRDPTIQAAGFQTRQKTSLTGAALRADTAMEVGQRTKAAIVESDRYGRPAGTSMMRPV